MSSFIVETSEELPKILVFVANQDSRHRVEPFLKEKGFIPEVYVIDEKNNRELVFAPSLKRGEWYKIIIWLDQLFLSEKQAFLPSLVEFLMSRSEEKIWVGTLLTSLEVCDVFPAWVQATVRQQEVLYLMNQVKKSTFLLGKNVVPGSGNVTLEKQPLAYMQTPEADGTILVPRTKLSFLSEQLFDQEVKKKLLQPRHASTLFQGEPEIECRELLREWGDVQEVDCSFGSIALVEEKLQKHVLPDQQVMSSLQNFIYNGASPYPSEPGQVMKPRSVQVVPLKQPLIENRQKKYERRVAELQKQKVLRKKLPVRSQRLPVSTQLSEKPHYGKQEKINKLLEGEIFSLFGQQRAQQKVARVNQKVQKTIHYTKKNDRQLKFGVVFAVLLTIIGFFVGLAAAFILSQKTLTSSLINFAETLPKLSEQEKQSQLKSLNLKNSIFSTQVDGYKFFLGKQAFPFSSQITVMAQEIIDTNSTTVEMEKEGNTLFSQVLGKSSGNVFTTFSAFSTRAQEQYKNLSLLQSQLQTFDSQELSDNQEKHLKDLGNSFQEERKNLATFQQLEQVLPSILAQDKRKTYLVLLQNTQELRPTGGFLQTVAFLTVENGVIINHQVLDVKLIDGALTGQIDPPKEVKDMLGQSKWYLRDSNWSPDFTSSGPQAMRFVEKGIGKKVDGVLAMNTQVFAKLLQGFGPLSVSQYSEVITDKNLLEKMEFHSEIPLAKPDAQEYSTVVFSEFFDQLANADSSKMMAVSSQLYDSLKSGEAFFYTNDETINSVLKNLGWNGEVVTPECPAQMSDGPCVVDSAMVVEANIGINKANYYVNRSFEDTVVIGEANITHTRKVVLTNSSTSNAWPAGPYKSFVRLYVPKSAQLGNVLVDDVPIDPKLILVGSEKEKTYFGTRVEVPIQKTVTLTFTYTEPLDVTGSFAYTFFNQRQAGTGESPLQITISANGRRPVRIAPQAEVTGGEVKFSIKQDKHAFVGVKYN
jgi:hypothetical protein